MPTCSIHAGLFDTGIPCKIALRCPHIPAEKPYVFLPGAVHIAVAIVDFPVQECFARMGAFQDTYQQPQLDQLLHVIKLIDVRMQPDIFFTCEGRHHVLEPEHQLFELVRCKGPPARNTV